MARKGAVLPMGLVFVLIILLSIMMASRFVRHEIETQHEHQLFLSYKVQAITAIQQMKRDNQQPPYQTSDGNITITESSKYYYYRQKTINHYSSSKSIPATCQFSKN